MRPKIVCLCGSTRFPEAFAEANRQESLNGHIVLSVGCFGHLEGMDMSGPVKRALDALHLRKIDLADEILVLNVNDYIGLGTCDEIGYAWACDKPVRFWEPHQECRRER